MITDIVSSEQKAEHLTQPKYRADIDGLRAIAVLSVVGFHAFPDWVKGGFIGVDIFFVISGFLISTIIYQNLNLNSFSFLQFYSRRIKRIFPSLLLVLIASLVYGWYELFPEEYTLLNKHVSAGAGFISNLLLWKESGYFDRAAETKHLLHLWSLGIEEQFYILWPLILWFSWKRRWNLLLVTAGLALASFGFNIWKIKKDITFAFYLPQTRIWELLAGSCLAYFTLFKQNTLNKFKLGGGSLQSSLGAALIFLGLLFITQDRNFPGWWALLPVAGSLFIISACPYNRVNTILSNPVLVWFGLISYPLYLWHWPVLTYSRMINHGTKSPEIRITAVLLSIVLAWLTYKLIEKPIRFGGNANKKVCALTLLAFTVGCFSYYSYKHSNIQWTRQNYSERDEFYAYFENSIPDWKYYEKIGLAEKYRMDCDFYDIMKYRNGNATSIPRDQISKSCYERDPNKKNAVFIWGDSHAQQFYYGLNKNLPHDWQIQIIASSGCPPNAGILEDSESDYCLRSNWLALRTIQETKPNVVLIAQERGHGNSKMRAIRDKLRELGVSKVVFVGPSPHWSEPLPRIIVRSLWRDTPERTTLGINQDIVDRNRMTKEKFVDSEDCIFVDIINFFCNEDGCLTRTGPDRKLDITSWDYGHLSPPASDYLARKLLSGIVFGESGRPQR